ncbi:MAG: prepilin-type N-terminal cleavage/methylation domain-containing protein [Elusimicrobia bacterium]|nr:prepilin-type N-terminal cleavage/methylation domain-containing protein [Elusimicrobiota bacterium]
MKHDVPGTGFTLIELMLVVAIIGLLAAIALPKVANLVFKAKEASVKGKLGGLRSAISIYYADNEGEYPDLPLSALTVGSRYIDRFPRCEVPTAPTHGAMNGVGPFSPLSDWTPGNTWAWSYSPSSGTLFVHCTHTDTRGFAWSLY